MEEMEVPLEGLQENINEKAEHGHEKKDNWSLYVAISTAFMAAFAALGSLMAGHHSDEALISQIKASDQWAYYQAKGIKSAVLETIIHQDERSNAEPAKELKQKQADYKKDQAEITEKAKDFEKESEEHLRRHVIIARSVTLFQIAIAISAISILTRRRFLWYLALVLSIGGIWQFVMGII